MAKATETRVERTVTLELTEREAAFVYYLVGRTVIGSTDGPRKHADDIYQAMRPLGLSIEAIKAASVRGDGVSFGAYQEGNK